MKRIYMLLLGLAMCCAALPSRSVQAQDTVSFELFYDSLEPYGEWIEVGEFGYCWRPFVAMDDPMWRPYADGYWAHTDGGWTWVSNEDFGWATYHYGRWARVIGLGWVWVPGYEWAPAWVSWRDTPDREYIGWAPLPPEARFEISIGFNTWVDDYYDIGPSCYNFIRYRDFGEPRLRSVILPYERNVTIINHSVNVTHITYRDSVVNNIYIGGPQIRFVKERSVHEVRELKLRRRDDFDADRLRRDPRDYARALNRREGDTLLVASPAIRRFRDDERHGPTHIKRRLPELRIDRGWEGVKDATVAQRLRERMKQDADRSRPQTLPDKRSPFGPRERDGRVGAGGGPDNRGRVERDEDKSGRGQGMPPVAGRETLPVPGASQQDIARRLEEERRRREPQRGMEGGERDRDGNGNRVGRPGGAPGTDMAAREREREKDRQQAMEQEQRQRAEAEGARQREMAETRRREEMKEAQAKQDQEKAKEMDQRRRQDAERMARQRTEEMERRRREEGDKMVREKADAQRREAEARRMKQMQDADRARNMERERVQRAAMEKQREAAENAARQRRDAENNQRRAMEEARRRNDDNQREAAERSRRAAEENRRQQLQSQQRRTEEARPQPKQAERREANPGGRERGRPKDDDDKEKGGRR